MTFEFSGSVWFWKGPAPFYFATIPADDCVEIKALESMSTYGWGMIPVNVQIGETRWYTALWPKDGLYILPLKTRVRKAENIKEGDTVDARLEIILKR